MPFYTLKQKFVNEAIEMVQELFDEFTKQQPDFLLIIMD